MLHIQLQSLSKERLIQPGKCIHWVGHWKGWQAWQGQEIGGFFCSYTLKSLKITLFIFVGKLWMCERNKEMVWAHLNGLLKLALVARLLKTVPKVTEWWCRKDFTPGWDSQPSTKRSHPQFSIYNFIVKIFWNDLKLSEIDDHIWHRCCVK